MQSGFNLQSIKFTNVIFPENFEQKIDFHVLRTQMEALCTFPLGKEEVQRIVFTSNKREIELMLDETHELMRILQDASLDLPVGGFYDLREDLARIRVEGLFLDENELFQQRKTLEATHQLRMFIQTLPEHEYPILSGMASQLPPLSLILRDIDRILDKFGRIKDNASPELATIRKELSQAQSSVSRLINSILKQAQTDGYIERDVSPTMREGRLVIPVPPMYKRKLGGIVHDESATGKTVFVEPAQVVEANNRIRELEGEQRREIIRILTLFANQLRPHIPDLLNTQLFLGHIDFLRAKALFAQQIGAIRPTVTDEPLVDWQRARHPLLLLTLQKQGKAIVPLDILLNEKQRILLISGPNAGGKSVCLKTVALLQYMLQCGLPVPVLETSQMGIFQDIFIDIGDEQSIEDDLSTYSSHLRNMKHFVRYAKERTLLLIDEFGGGTEPQIGGAIAEATLDRLNKNGAYGVITTHYTNLKHFAEDVEGIVNGAMLYDRHNMQPLFVLQIGRPGSSFAVEIARKIGLPEDIIQAAVDKVGAEHVDYDKHLQDIARDKRYWETKRQKIRQQEKKLEETIARYQNEMDNINRTKKEIVSKAKQDAADLLQQSNSLIENTIRKIKEAQADKETTRKVRQELEEYKQQISDNPKLKAAKSKPVKNKPQIKNTERELAVGDTIRLKGQSMNGTILEIQGKNALVAIGALKSNVPLERLEYVSRTQLKKQTSATGARTSDEVRQRKLSFKHDIDLRGMRADEALQAVMYFIDDAIMVGAGTVRILHGTGTGALRQVIRQYLSTVSGVASYHDEHVQFGGAGITVVELE